MKETEEQFMGWVIELAKLRGYLVYHHDWEVTKMALEELAHSAGSGSMALVCRQVIDSIRQQVNEQRI